LPNEIPSKKGSPMLEFTGIMTSAIVAEFTSVLLDDNKRPTFIRIRTRLLSVRE
jgi:hypothetical protein